MVAKRQVAVVVDSSSCLPPQVLHRWQIFVAPHQLVIGPSSYRDGIDITPAQFYRLLRNGHGKISTSSPEPAAFLQAFESASKRADSVLCITISTRFSTTYDAARMACEEARNALPNLQIRVLDSRVAAGAAGFVALEAARAAAQGYDLESATCRAREIVPRVRLLAVLDSLGYLAQSGKVARAKLWAGSALGIKPLFELGQEEPRLVARPRSRARAMDQLVEAIKSRAGDRPVHVNVMEADVPTEAEELRQRVEKEFHCRELFISQFTPVMGVHTGPGLLGLAFYTDS